MTRFIILLCCALSERMWENIYLVICLRGYLWHYFDGFFPLCFMFKKIYFENIYVIKLSNLCLMQKKRINSFYVFEVS